MSVDKARLLGGARAGRARAAASDRGAAGAAGAVGAAGRQERRVAPLVGAELVDAAHSAGLRVYTWTLRPENRFLSTAYRRGSARAAFGDWLGEFEHVIRTGVDGIFVDHPDLGVDVRAAVSSVG